MRAGALLATDARIEKHLHDGHITHRLKGWPLTDPQKPGELAVAEHLGMVSGTVGGRIRAIGETASSCSTSTSLLNQAWSPRYP